MDFIPFWSAYSCYDLYFLRTIKPTKMKPDIIQANTSSYHQAQHDFNVFTELKKKGKLKDGKFVLKVAQFNTTYTFKKESKRDAFLRQLLFNNPNLKYSYETNIHGKD